MDTRHELGRGSQQLHESGVERLLCLAGSAGRNTNGGKGEAQRALRIGTVMHKNGDKGKAHRLLWLAGGQERFQMRCRCRWVQVGWGGSHAAFGARLESLEGHLGAKEVVAAAQKHAGVVDACPTAQERPRERRTRRSARRSAACSGRTVKQPGRLAGGQAGTAARQARPGRDRHAGRAQNWLPKLLQAVRMSSTASKRSAV